MHADRQTCAHRCMPARTCTQNAETCVCIRTDLRSHAYYPDTLSKHTASRAYAEADFGARRHTTRVRRYPSRTQTLTYTEDSCVCSQGVLTCASRLRSACGIVHRPVHVSEPEEQTYRMCESRRHALRAPCRRRVLGRLPAHIRATERACDVFPGI